MSATPLKTIETPVTKLLGITHPIFLAGMNVAGASRVAICLQLLLLAVCGVGYSCCLP